MKLLQRRLKGSEVRERFEEIKKGVLGAIDFLRTNIKVYSTGVLPFPSVIIPLSVYFATKVDQDTHPSSGVQQRLVRWTWRTFFSRRYSKRLEQLNDDVKEMVKLKSGLPNTLGDFSVEFGEEFFTKSLFNLNTANTKTYILMLAAEGPLNFVSGGPVSMEPVLRNCNKKEFHHVYPKKFLSCCDVPVKDINSLVNFVVLSKADNNRLGGVAPSAYRAQMPSSGESVRLILTKALCPSDIFHDDFRRFVLERVALLVDKGRELMQLV